MRQRVFTTYPLSMVYHTVGGQSLQMDELRIIIPTLSLIIHTTKSLRDRNERSLDPFLLFLNKLIRSPQNSLENWLRSRIENKIVPIAGYGRSRFYRRID